MVRRPETLSLGLGLALSALIHVIVLVWSPGLIVSSRSAARPGAVLTPPDGVRLIVIAPPRRGASREGLTKLPKARPSLPSPTHPAAVMPVAPAVAQRMAPQLGEGHVWTRRDTLRIAERSELDRARERLHGELQAIIDSIVPEHEAAQRARNWTLTDSHGRSWGYSRADDNLPGTVKLGGRTLRYFTLELAGSNDAAQRVRDWQTARYHTGLAEVRDQFDDRVKAIRERKDQERARKKGGSM